MYVIRGQLDTAFEGIEADTEFSFPADRCVWEIDSDSTGGYSITKVRFFGNGATSAPVSSATFGYIGKSARFVPISN